MEIKENTQGHPSLIQNLRFKISSSLFSRKRYLQLERPLVTFTFDDVPVSAFTQGAPILEKYGCRATFYISGRNFGSASFINEDQIKTLHQRGHEIACHSFSHLRTDFHGTAKVLADCRKNQEVLREKCGVTLKNFAYPQGAVGLWNKKPLLGNYRSLRGVHSGVNAGEIDLGLLKACPMFQVSKEEIVIWIREAAEKNGWLIFYGHDVAINPSPWGTTPALLEFMVQQSLNAGLSSVTVEEALSEAVRGD